MGCHFLLQGIFPTEGSNPDLPALQADALPSGLREGSPSKFVCPQLLRTASRNTVLSLLPLHWCRNGPPLLYTTQTLSPSHTVCLCPGWRKGPRVPQDPHRPPAQYMPAVYRPIPLKFSLSRHLLNYASLSASRGWGWGGCHVAYGTTLDSGRLGHPQGQPGLSSLTSSPLLCPHFSRAGPRSTHRFALNLKFQLPSPSKQNYYFCCLPHPPPPTV